ncbi:MAG: hypothetical protein Q4A78_02680 [Peptostreptococcaceae bacterium]|nr:hypothetical protein [Peptostreptococcaceae bacterium]
MAMLKTGDRIPLFGIEQSVRVEEYIAQGGQGEVYRVSYHGGDYALKWYKKIPSADAFYLNLAHNITVGPPAQHYLWPLALTERVKGRFGYIMKLRPEEYRKYGEFLMGEINFFNWNALFSAALHIVESYFLLHSMGYSYQDLNEGSFFINPKNGDVLICDNDNVAPYGVNLGVRGTPRYMAPEVVLDQALPNTHTDRFSLAVILFRLFYIDHPLEGRHTVQFPLTDEIGAQLFGENPLFIYDPQDQSNRPHPEAHVNVIRRWNIFPPDLKAAFTRAFTRGLKDINGRITEQQWREVLVKARGMLVTIGGKQQFVNAYAPDTLPKECRLLRTEEQVIALAPGSLLYRCQTDKLSTDYMTASALVKASVKNKRIYGLGNLTESEWIVTLPNKAPVRVRPKGFAPLLPGTIIDFGNIKGKVF